LLERKAVIVIPRPVLYLITALVFVYVKLISLFFKSFDPFIPFENLFSAIFFGGLLDAFRKANVSTPANASNGATSVISTAQVHESDLKSKDVKKTN
jgi:hypothetical protein